MSLLAKLKEKARIIQENSSVTTISVSITEASTTSPATASETKLEEDNETTWLENQSMSSMTTLRSNREVLPTPVITVTPEDLVWAPYYRCKDKLFCARICPNSDAATIRHIKEWPIPNDKVIVEIFCQEKTPTSVNRLLVMKKSVIPFWATKSNDEPQSNSRTWNQVNLDKMRNALHSKYGVEDGQYFYDKIEEVARKFIKKAFELIEDDQSEDGESQDNPKKRKKLSKDVNGIDSTACASSDVPEPKPSIASLGLKAHKLTLHIGDIIRYTNKVFPDLKSQSKIVNFTGNKDKPIELQDGYVLDITDMVGKADKESMTILANCTLELLDQPSK